MIIIPMRIQFMLSIITMIMLILFINLNDLTFYNLLLNSDLISTILILLRLWILILIKLRQFRRKFVKSLFFIFIVLNLRLIFSFRSTSVLIFYFFFEWSFFSEAPTLPNSTNDSVIDAPWWVDLGKTQEKFSKNFHPFLSAIMLYLRRRSFINTRLWLVSFATHLIQKQNSSFQKH
mgnify:CR=1 FL=1